MTEPEFYSTAEAAAKLNISTTRVQALCASGDIIGAFMVGGRWLIPSPLRRSPPRRPGRRPKNAKPVST